MEMPKPAAAHQPLQKMAGIWTGQEKMYPSPWVPEETTLAARIENRLALGGFVVIQDYAQYDGGQPAFEGHGVVSWDPGAGQYLMHWFDSMGMPANVFQGSFQGDVLVLTSIGAQGQMRGTWDYSGGDTCAFEMSVSPDGSNWHKMIDGKYRRVSA